MNNSIGDKPAFSSNDNYKGFANYGMTYREWLIGQALAGVIAGKLDSETMPDINIADSAICIADYIIERLDKEAHHVSKG